MNSETIQTLAEREPPQKGTLAFLFVDHSTENVPEITRQIAESDADIVLQELVGQPTALRQEVESKINRAISAETLEERTRLAEGLMQHFRDLIWALAGSKKTFHFVDVASDMPEYADVIKARDAYRMSPEKGGEGFFKAVTMRNQLVASQIESYAAADETKKILVVLGALHTGILETFTDSTVLYSGESVKNDAEVLLSRLASQAVGTAVSVATE